MDKGTPTEEITKEAVDEIVHYGGEEIKPGHKDEFDPNAPKGSKEDVPGKTRYQKSVNRRNCTSSGWRNKIRSSRWRSDCR